MEAFAYVNFVRMSPRKVKLVCDMIRGQDVKTATAYLRRRPSKSVFFVNEKTLHRTYPKDSYSENYPKQNTLIQRITPNRYLNIDY